MLWGGERGPISISTTKKVQNWHYKEQQQKTISPLYFKTFFVSTAERDKVSENYQFQMNNSTGGELEDFEVFDLRDAINVAAYTFMSASEFNIRNLGVCHF